MNYFKVESQKSKDKRVYMKAILLILSLVIITPAMAATPQHKGGVPTLNANANKKKAEDTRRTGAAAGNAYSTPAQSNVLAVPSAAFQSTLTRRTAVPYVAPARSDVATQTSAASAPVFTFMTTESAKRAGGTQSLSGGAAAGGLMTTGSQYSSAATNGGGSTTVSAPSSLPSSGPRKLPDHDEEWWITPVGDVLFPLALLALAYCGFLICKKRKHA